MQNKNSLLVEIVLSFRPKTLTAALVPCLAASAWCWASGRGFHGPSLFFALVSSFCIQIATNLFNDAIDFKKGADNERRIGPKRITQSGLLSSKSVLGLGALFLIFALLAGYPLLLRGGEPILSIGLFSLFLAYGYTGGPYPLAYKGLGDVFVILFFGLIAVGGMIYLHQLTWPLESLILGLQIGFLAAVLIAINNLRDHRTDADVGKKTLAVRLGVQGARWEILFLALVPYALSSFWFFNGYPWAGGLTFLSLPFALTLTKNIFNNEPGPVYNEYLGKAALLHLAFGLLLSAGFVIS